MLLFEITVIVTLKTVYILVIKIVQFVVLPSILSFTLRTGFYATIIVIKIII